MESGAEQAVFRGSLYCRGCGSKARDVISTKLKKWMLEHPEAHVIEQQRFIQGFGAGGEEENAVYWGFSTVLMFKFKQKMDC